MDDVEAHFGGPDAPRGHLRDLLSERVRAVPAGGSIHWVTYYFRDRRLAADLLQAARRGVDVRVVLSARPRRPRANDAVIDMLSGADGLGGGLRLVTLPGLPSPAHRSFRPQIHEKIYCFSHPEPIAYIGSFNPSGDDPELSPATIADIGDQDAGDNFLVGLRAPAPAQRLTEHVRMLHERPPGLFHRLASVRTRDLIQPDLRIHFWPRVGRNPVLALLDQLGEDSEVCLAASHLRARQLTRALVSLAERGASVCILGAMSRRRTPDRVARQFVSAGIEFIRHGGQVSQASAPATARGGKCSGRRVNAEQASWASAPLHLKFLLIRAGNLRRSVFGSLNWTLPSFYLNHEVVVVSDHPMLYRTFEQRWLSLYQMRGRQTPDMAAMH